MKAGDKVIFNKYHRSLEEHSDILKLFTVIETIMISTIPAVMITEYPETLFAQNIFEIIEES